ncbi:SEC14-like protein 4, partial [Araneus ventricosus]
GWKEELLEIIDGDGLPAYLGGTRTDPDGNPLCETFIFRGRPIPKSYYMNKKNKKLSLSSDAETLTVKPFSKEEICFEVKEENSYFELEFQTKNRDIDFSLYFKEGASEDSEPVAIIPKQRIEASDEPEKGRFKCEKAGIYTIVFDNSHSWFYSKEVYYRAEIKGPRNDEIYRLT